MGLTVLGCSGTVPSSAQVRLTIYLRTTSQASMGGGVVANLSYVATTPPPAADLSPPGPSALPRATPALFTSELDLTVDERHLIDLVEGEVFADEDPSVAALPALPHRGHWLRSNVESLHNLATFVSSSSGVVACSIFNRGYREMAANWMHSLARFGGIKEALLFSFDEECLRECLALGIACFNGQRLFLNGISLNSTYHPDSPADVANQHWNKVGLAGQ